LFGQDSTTKIQITTYTNIANSKPAAIISTQDYFTQLLAKAEQGDIKEVIADLNWIFKADSQDAHAYCCRGVVYYKIGNYQDAIADFNQAIQLNF
jgi:tetratricopeptide (TPR) repeat protein